MTPSAFNQFARFDCRVHRPENCTKGIRESDLSAQQGSAECTGQTCNGTFNPPGLRGHIPFVSVADHTGRLASNDDWGSLPAYWNPARHGRDLSIIVPACDHFSTASVARWCQRSLGSRCNVSASARSPPHHKENA